MTNEQRREQITTLKERINPLELEKFITSLSYNFHLRELINNESEENKNKLDELTGKLNTINNELEPLLTRLRYLQVRYNVEYEGDVHAGLNIEKVLHNECFYLSTDIDMVPDQGWNLNNPDCQELIKEISNFIHMYQYSTFSIKRIQRLKD